MIESVWKFPVRKNLDSIQLGIDLYPQIKSILVNRGIDNTEKFRIFSKPNVKDLYSPWLMKDMDKAVGRVIEALNGNQKILVYGDYDVDGTTSIALVYSFLKDREANVDFYVPDRYAEGYGVSEKGIKTAIENGVNLIITLDCGIKAVKNITMAQDAGIDVIVCDHHNQGAILPPAYAVLDPKRHDCKYPFKELSGCGVGFKLLHALCEKLNLSLKDNLYCYLDYLAISTAADIVPIVSENHIYMYYGLLKMIQKPLMSVKIMLANAKLIFLAKNKEGEEIIISNAPLTVSDIVFKIAPKINAAGRMQSANDAIFLLLSKTKEETYKYFETVDGQNKLRREKELIICQEAIEMLQNNSETDRLCTNVLYKNTWHKGVVGIAASKVIESFYKPTIILCGEGDVISGSARSVADFDLYGAIEKCSEYLCAFGGHKHAAGLSMKKSEFENFRRNFESIVSASIEDSQKKPTILIDEELSLDDINFNFYNELQYLAPFGPQNMEPVFVMKGVVPCNSYFMGNDDSHLRLKLKINERETISCVGFGMSEKWKTIRPNAKIDICFTIETNVYQGKVYLQLMLKDVRESKD